MILSPIIRIGIVAGRSFSHDYPADDTTAFIINESAIKSFGFTSPDEALGRHIDLQGRKGVIVGVLQDFHYRSLHYGVEHLLLYISSEEIQKLSLKIESTSLITTVARIEKTWKELVQLPFNYTFLDQDFNRLYKRENQLSKFIAIFGAMAIFVACLGLFGLTSFSIERRFKEIGIRKVLGASVGGILSIISKDFMRLILVSFVISIPLTYYLITLWLNNFVNRIAIQPKPFLISGLSVFVFASIIIGFLCLKVARTNTVDSLRSEQ